MSKYFHFFKGKVFDIRWKSRPNEGEWLLYLDRHGEEKVNVGILFKMSRDDWSAVSLKDNHSLGPVSGFRSRRAASFFLLKFLKTEQERRDNI